MNEVEEKMRELEVLNREIERASVCEISSSLRLGHCYIFSGPCDYTGPPSPLYRKFGNQLDGLVIRHAWLKAARRDLLKKTPALTLLTGEKMGWRGGD